MEIYNKIHQLRIMRNMTLEELAAKTGYKDKSSVFRVEKGEYDIPQSKIQAFADALNVSVGTLLNDDIQLENTEIHSFDVPIYAPISCGTGGFVDDQIIDHISLPDNMINPSKEYFGQYADGDSMIGEGIRNTDICIFEKTCSIDNGEIGCFCIDENTAVCKKFYCDKEHSIITLQPANDKYEPIIVTVENQCFRCLGRLALVISNRQKQ